MTVFNTTTPNSEFTFSNGDLTAAKASGTSAGDTAFADLSRATGKWQVEFTLDVEQTNGTRSPLMGITSAAIGATSTTLQQATDVSKSSNGSLYFAGTDQNPGDELSPTDVVTIQVDLDGLTAEVFKNGVSLHSGAISAGTYFPAIWSDSNTDTITANFGASAFTTPLPAGYTSWDGNQTVPESLELTGPIVETTNITEWDVHAFSLDGTTHLVVTATGAVYNLPVTLDIPYIVTGLPSLQHVWAAGVVVASGDYTTSETTPHIWVAGGAGTTGGTEPTWNLTGTTVDNDITWTYVEELVQPVSQAPLMPTPV